MFENISRERLEEFLIRLGGRITSAVSGKTDYLVVGSKLEDDRDVKTSTKYRKAQEKGTSILTEQQLEDFLKRTLNNMYFTFDNYENWDKPLQCKRRLKAAQKANVVEQVIEQEKKKNKKAGATVDNRLLTDKYKPVTSNDLVGNKGSIDSLRTWLKDWDDVHIRGNKKPVKPVRGNWANAPKPNAKAVMISGPPGIGKTSTARIVAEELGFEIIEMNASDTRNKKTIESMIGELSTNNSLDYYTKDRSERKQNLATTHKKSVIIMDEVDGCGGGDRGGISALIQVIKISKTPIICICNDRENRKLMSLLNHCFDIKFVRPTPQQILSRVKQIANAEGLTIDDKAIDLLVNQAGSDIRQVITQIQVLLTTCKSISHKDLSARMNNISKDQKIMINNFQAASKLLNYDSYKSMTYRDRMDMFFIDYDFVPLLVQENYLTALDTNYNKNSAKDVERLANAAAFIAFGDQVNKRVRGNMEWTLLGDCGLASSIAPCHYTKGSIHYPKFPEWMGKNSSATKSKRLINELKKAFGHRILCDRKTLLNEYLPLVFDVIIKHLEKDSYEDAIAVMDELNITNEQFREHVLGLLFDKKRAKKADDLNAKSKAAFTRAYNATHKTSLKPKKKKKEGADVVEVDQYDPDKDEPDAMEEDIADSEESDFDIEPTNKPSSGKGKGNKGKDKDKEKETKAKSKAKSKKK